MIWFQDDIFVFPYFGLVETLTVYLRRIKMVEHFYLKNWYGWWKKGKMIILVPSKNTYFTFLLSSSRGGFLLSTKNGESSSLPPLVESTKNGILCGELRSYSSSEVLLSSSKNSFLLLWIIFVVPSTWGEFSIRGAPSEFLLRRANHMTWGFRQFQILPQEVSRVKFNCIQKIKLRKWSFWP